MDNILKVCEDWVLEKEASYLCLEDYVVYFESALKSGAEGSWIHLRLSEVARIIKYNKLDATDSKLMNNNLLVQVFQELGLVFERGVKTDEDVKQAYFNYNKKTPKTKPEMLMELLVKEVAKDFKGIQIASFNLIFDLLLDKYGLFRLTNKTKNKYLKKALFKNGFELREKSFRVVVNGKKVTVLLKRGCKPKDITDLTETKKKELVRNINI